MAIHGHPRATIDIGLLVQPDDVERIFEAVRPLGFSIEARPMNFSGSAMQIRRISKVDERDGEVLMLDMLLVTPETRSAWETRQEVPWQGYPLTVVSRDGLILLKKFRSSKQDLADIEALSES